jgi:hypothetical protein
MFGRLQSIGALLSAMRIAAVIMRTSPPPTAKMR